MQRTSQIRQVPYFKQVSERKSSQQSRINEASGILHTEVETEQEEEEEEEEELDLSVGDLASVPAGLSRK